MLTLRKKSICLSIFAIAIFVGVLAVNVSADEHRWSEWITDVQPTCTTDGHMYRICDLYKGYEHMEEKAIPKLGHSYSVTTYAPTCVLKGEKIYTCDRCNRSYTEEFGELTDHTFFESVSKEPTCEVAGVKSFVCSNCGYSYTEAIPATGHNYGEWITQKLASESEAGLRIRVCANDDTHIIQESIPKLHSRADIASKYGKRFRVNKLDVILTAVNVSLVWLVALIIYPYALVLLWAKRKRREKMRELEEKHEAK